MAAPKTIHISPNGSGSWVVRTGEARSGKVFATQAEAVRAAADSARAVGGQIRLQTATGEVKKAFTLGRTTMERLNVVEGVSLTPAGRSTFKGFDRDGLSADQRRIALRKDVTKLAGPAKPKRGSASARSHPPKG